MGCETLYFLDACSSYHQIWMKESGQLATSFITPYGMYMMPFGLKNTGVTYQRCMQGCLDNLIGEVIEVYTNDIVVKFKKVDPLVEILEQTFM